MQKKPIKIKVSVTGCHEIISHKPTRRGYVTAWVDGEEKLLHRYFWEKHHNKVIPDGFVIMHTCDNRKCVNINHLKLGTQSENVQDMHDKNRGYRYRIDGTFIKPLRLLKGLSIPQLAIKCGVNRTLLWKIEKGKIMTTQTTLDKILVVLGGVTNG
jgi:DNA-binding XRE family transcriptional regulator